MPVRPDAIDALDKLSEERARRGILLELDFSDADLVVREHPDGMFTIDLNEPRLVVNAEEFQAVVAGFVRIAHVRGWISDADTLHADV